MQAPLRPDPPGFCRSRRAGGHSTLGRRDRSSWCGVVSRLGWAKGLPLCSDQFAVAIRIRCLRPRVDQSRRRRPRSVRRGGSRSGLPRLRRSLIGSRGQRYACPRTLLRLSGTRPTRQSHNTNKHRRRAVIYFTRTARRWLIHASLSAFTPQRALMTTSARLFPQLRFWARPSGMSVLQRGELMAPVPEDQPAGVQPNNALQRTRFARR